MKSNTANSYILHTPIVGRLSCRESNLRPQPLTHEEHMFGPNDEENAEYFEWLRQQEPLSPRPMNHKERMRLINAPLPLPTTFKGRGHSHGHQRNPETADSHWSNMRTRGK